MSQLDNAPVTTLLLGVAFIIVVIVGGLVCVLGDDFEFQEYATTVGILAGALGLLGIGRGINSGEKHRAAAEGLSYAERRWEAYDEPEVWEDEAAAPEPVPEDLPRE